MDETQDSNKTNQTRKTIENSVIKVINKLIKNTEWYSSEKINILFSKQIEDWKKINNKEPEKQDLIDIITTYIVERAEKIISQLPSKTEINIQEYSNGCYSMITEGNMKIDFVIFQEDSIIFPPYKLRTATKNNKLLASSITKRTQQDRYSIADILWDMEYENQQEYDERKQDINVWMSFFHNENNDKINKIQLSRRNCIRDDNEYENLAEFILDENGKITEMKKQKKQNDITEQEETINIEENEEQIKQEFLNIFCNTKDIAMQNILAELDSKQLKIIDNIKSQFGIPIEVNNSWKDWFKTTPPFSCCYSCCYSLCNGENEEKSVN